MPIRVSHKAGSFACGPILELSPAPFFLLLLARYDFRKHTRFQSETLHHVVDSHDTEKLSTVTYNRNAPDTVDSHPLQCLR